MLRACRSSLQSFASDELERAVSSGHRCEFTFELAPASPIQPTTSPSTRPAPPPRCERFRLRQIRRVGFLPPYTGVYCKASRNTAMFMADNGGRLAQSVAPGQPDQGLASCDA